MHPLSISLLCREIEAKLKRTNKERSKNVSEGGFVIFYGQNSLKTQEERRDSGLKLQTVQDFMWRRKDAVISELKGNREKEFAGDSKLKIYNNNLNKRI